jgi:VTC domain-containing protein
MSGRIEYKYLAPQALLGRIRADLSRYLEADRPPVAPPSPEYTVRSVYFDTPRFHCFEEKLGGLRLRNKFRVRGYGCWRDDSLVFLEIKRKCDAFVEKHRAPLRHRDLEAFFATRDIDRYIVATSGTDREKQDAIRFLYHYGRNAIRPVIRVVYDREAFLGKFDSSLRLTFDKNIRAARSPSLDALYDEDSLVPSIPNHFVIEIKFFRCALPAWVPALVQRYELPRLAISKYAICLDEWAMDRSARRMRGRFGAPVPSAT